MTKNATVWYPVSGQGDVNTDDSGDLLLLENGDKVLLETGDDIILEDITQVPKAATVWSEA